MNFFSVGHLHECLQALKFGNDKEACLKAIDIGFELAPRPNNTIYKGALKTLQMVNADPRPAHGCFCTTATASLRRKSRHSPTACLSL